MSERRADLVIVGTGPAGCAAAMFLHQRLPSATANAVVLERKHHPRPKGCGGGLTGRTSPLLQRLGLPANPTHALEAQGMRFQHGSCVTHLVLPHPLPVARRWELDALLADRTRQVVGEFREGEPARRIRREGDHLEVVTDDAVYRTRLVIDASGSRCVSRRSGLLPPDRRLVPVWIAEGPPAPDEPVFDGSRELLFDFSEMAAGAPGYYWSFPCMERGERYVSRGFYPASGLAVAGARAALARRLAAHGVDPASVRPIAYPARLFDVDSVCAAPGLLAVGDAAGVDPVFGEGISQSLEYGWHAARVAARALKRGRFEFGPRPHLPWAGLGGRLHYLAKMQDELYVPGYERRLAFAMGSGAFQRLVYADSRGSVPGPLLWSAGAVLALAYRRFAHLSLETPWERTFHL